MRAAEFMRALADVIDALDGKKGKTEKPDFQQNPVPMTPQQQALEFYIRNNTLLTEHYKYKRGVIPLFFHYDLGNLKTVRLACSAIFAP